MNPITKTLTVLIFLPLVLSGAATQAEPIAPPIDTPIPEDQPVAVELKEWTQHEWTHPGRSLYRYKGDFYDLSCLMRDAKGRLRRCPAFSSYVEIASGFDDLIGVWYNEDTAHWHVLGTYNSMITTIATDDDWDELETVGNIQNLLAAIDTLGGLIGRNYSFWGGDLYIIGDDKKVYRGSPALGQAYLSELDGGGDVVLLCPYGDRMYAATETGTIMRLTDADDGFDDFYDPVGDLQVVYMAGIKEYLAVVTIDPTGNLIIHKLDPTTAPTKVLDELGSLDFGTPSTNGAFFVTVGDNIYLSPGSQLMPDDQVEIPIYRFNGSRENDAIISHVTTLVLETGTGYGAGYTADTSVGLLNWRGRLVLYTLPNPSGSAVTHTLHVLTGDGFTTLATTTCSAAMTTPIAVTAGGEIIVGNEDGGSEHGFKHFGNSGGLQDGYLQTSYLDMGSPGKEKRLNRISVILNDEATGFKIVIKYRTDDTTSWTTATTANGTRHATIDITAPNTFYTIQLKIELDDDTGNNEDIRIDALSVIYSIDE